MKTKSNKTDHAPTPDWVEQAVQAHLASQAPPAPPASPEFHARCRAAGLAVLAVKKMKEQRVHLLAQPGSLLDHFDELADQAGVKLDDAFTALDINRANPSASALGLARLARDIGLSSEEAVLRVRWGVARRASMVLPVWPRQDRLARARQRDGVPAPHGSLERALLEQEKNYSSSLRAELRVALDAVAEVFGEGVF